MKFSSKCWWLRRSWPLATGVNAAELNINGVSDYAASADQVTSVTQFSDVYPRLGLSPWPTWWSLWLRHGYPNGTFRGNRAMTRFEAAALLSACLDRVTEVTDELKRLVSEFDTELAIIKGRVDGLEAKVRTGSNSVLYNYQIERKSTL